MANKLMAIEVSNKDTVDIVILNVIKMLSNRGVVKDVEEEYRKYIKKNRPDDMIYKIGQFMIKFVFQKITTINKAIDIIDFLKENEDLNKILIVKNVNKKAYKQIIEYSKTEVFWEHEFMFNLIDHHYIPKHELLEDKYINGDEKFFDIYLTSKKKCPKIEVTDPVARYYNMKPGQIVKITRPSITAGYDISYRIVVNSSINKLFN